MFRRSGRIEAACEVALVPLTQLPDNLCTSGLGDTVVGGRVGTEGSQRHANMQASFAWHLPWSACRNHVFLQSPATVEVRHMSNG
mmetsp:Transcript_34604/g.95326  ORF Transcript_34604/g.95326 Transcript_34604/m.95326 type:complete len:85 (+) Transcript_34604:2176-2430(+)